MVFKISTKLKSNQTLTESEKKFMKHRRIYCDSFEKLIKDSEVSVIPKVLEKFVCEVSRMYFEDPTRPRIVSSMNVELLAVMGSVNKTYIDILTVVFDKHLAINMNCTDTEQYLEKSLGLNPEWLLSEVDASSFDAHRSKAVMDIIDDFFVSFSI